MSVIVLSVVCMFPSMCLFVCFMFDCGGEMLTAFSICVCKVIVFSVKVIVLFLDCVFLLDNPYIVFQRVCVVFVIRVCVYVFLPFLICVFV